MVFSGRTATANLRLQRMRLLLTGLGTAPIRDPANPVFGAGITLAAMFSQLPIGRRRRKSVTHVQFTSSIVPGWLGSASLLSNAGNNERSAAQTRETAGSTPLTPGGRRQAQGLAPLVFELIRPYRGWLVIVLAAMLVETVMSLAAPWPLKIIIDNVVDGHKLPHWMAWTSHLLPSENKMGLAALAAIGAVLIAVLGAVASYIDNYYTESVGQWVANDLRMKVYSHLHHLSLTYYDTHQTGALLSTIIDDVSTIQDFASSTTLTMLVDLLTIIGILGMMLWLNWDFALMAVGVTPFLLWFVARFKKAVKKATHEVRVRQSDIVGVVQQGLESMRAVTAFGRQDLEERRLGEVSRATVDAALKARRVKSLLSPLVAVTVSFCMAFVLWRGASLSLTGVMTVGALTVFLAYLNKFFKPVQDLAKMANTIAQASVGLERIRAILDTDTSIPQRPDAREPARLRGEIIFDHVAFAYDAKAPVLREVNFSIAPGQRVGIVGPTGVGKSTVVSLIPRFYDPTGGRVQIDGVDLRDYTLQGLRNQIGFVLQDTVLFRGTVRDNIAYGRPDATQGQIIEAAKLANADEFIARMPDGYETTVGERGSTLSGGQRQRIGIARAVIRNSPILILDEPTASLDIESEKLVMEALERLMEGRTVITIAHRLSTIRDADKIIVLKDGVVAEEGTHDELLARGGIYADLARIQSEPALAHGGPSELAVPTSPSAHSEPLH
jgi:ABC-type multidrug transport system fused ATPase/permease subunit